MKLHFVDRSSLTDRSFSVKQNNYPYFLKVWHFHPEMELVCIQSSEGTRFIGDNIEPFAKGEVILIGENLPHMWLNHDHYFDKKSKLRAKATAVHFKKEFLGDYFFQIPEMKQISKLFERSKLGIKFINLDDKVCKRINGLPKLDGYHKLIEFLDILNSLANHDEFQLLSSQGYADSFRHIDNENMVKTYEYVYNNFTKSIYLKDVADVIHMNPASFSRFFKRINNRTFSRFLNEVRIGYACKLMIEKNRDITSICFESGFNNISNFNRQFKSIKGMSPTAYLKLHHK